MNSYNSPTITCHFFLILNLFEILVTLFINNIESVEYCSHRLAEIFIWLLTQIYALSAFDMDITTFLRETQN